VIELTMTSHPVYRTSAASPTVVALVDRGRALREAAGWDPHAMAAPSELSAPRASALEEMAAAYEGAIDAAPLSARMRARLALLSAGTPALLIYGGIFVASVSIVAAFALVAKEFGRWIVLLAPLTVVLVVLVAALALSSRESPRKWLSRNPLRIDGYLDLLGREERVVRVRAVVRFADRQGPDAELFKDLLTGAGVFTRGVERIDHGVFAVHSPEINGDASTLHRWVQRLCDAALVALSEAHAISAVVIEER
jgi:hypothetical protein